MAGTGSFFWENADGNAEYWAFELPTGTSEQVPVLGVGVGLDGVDLGLFNGITQPTLAVIDADRDSFIAMDFSADDAARLRSNAAMTISTSASDLTLAPTGELILGSSTGIAQMQTNGLTIGLAADAPAPDRNVVHIWAGDAGANVLANTSAVLVLESDSDHYVEFLSTTSNEAGLTFVDSLSSILGRFSYDHNGNQFTMVMGGYDRVVWSGAEVAHANAYKYSTSVGDLTLQPTGTVVLNSISAGVTANTNSTQGDNPITKMITQISVSATAGDAVTLPTAKAGLVIIVLNDGAEACDVFPATSDNINEAGANAAYSLAVDKNAMFIAHDATHWSVILTA